MSKFESGDVFFIRRNDFVAKAILFVTRNVFEGHSMVSHVGMVLNSTGEIIEALTKTGVTVGLIEKYNGVEIAIYRNTHLTYQARYAIALASLKDVGKPYGFFKILAHFIDRFVFFDYYVVRRLTSTDITEICSYFVPKWYKKVVGMEFGVEVGCANPDDIWDYVNNKENGWKCVLPLGKYDNL